MSVVNLAEALYILERERGASDIHQAIAAIDELPLTIIEAHRPLAFSAAHIKANHALSLADAFAAALAKEKEARLVTGDPEFETMTNKLSILWLRRK